MKIKPVGKIIFFIIALGAAFGLYRAYVSMTGGTGFTPGKVNLAGFGKERVEGDQGILGRPLRVGVVTWPGYMGGITANGGFKPNKECIYWKNHKLLVEFQLMEDVDVRA